MDLGSTQPLTEISTRSIYWGKGGRCVRLISYHHPVPLSCNLGILTSWNLLGHSGTVTGLIYFTLLFLCEFFGILINTNLLKPTVLTFKNIDEVMMKSVYSAVRTGSLNKAVCASGLYQNKQRLVPLTA